MQMEKNTSVNGRMVKRHGQGTFTSADGDKYVGEYKDGKKHGKGTFLIQC